MIWTVLVAVSISSLSFALHEEKECPRKEDIIPCKSCAVRYGYMDINCYPTHVNELREAFVHLKGKKNLSLTIDGFPLEKLPSDLFEGLDVVVLNLFDIERIGDEGRSSFEGLEDRLKKLYFWIDSFEKPLKYLNITAMNVLRILYIDLCEVPTLEKDFFPKYPVSIEELRIWSPQTSEIGDKVFEKFVNLKSLTVNGTMFGDFRRSMFPSPAPFLRGLTLSYNRISSLPEDMFVGMPSLRSVFLKNNRIARLPEATWSAIWSQLENVALDDNPLQCDSHIEWMFRRRSPKRLLGTCEPPVCYKKELKKVIEEKSI